ncbi:MAG TPA: PEGA domain-containing protein [Polyangia bacterium]|nr:PEGA domain-containing protein [Polyangia bacterium]
MRVIAIVATLSTLPIGATPARAATDTGDDLISEGMELRRKGDDAAALKRFREAYELTRSPRALAQMGLAEQALGSWSAADQALRAALESASDPWIGKHRVVLEQALATINRHLGMLEIAGSPEGAEIWVDGEKAGVLPAKIRVTTGTVVVEVRRRGFVSVRRTTSVGGGELTRERFNLQRSAAATSSEAVAPGAAATDAAARSGSGAAIAVPDSVQAGSAQEPDTPGVEAAAAPASDGASWRPPAIWTMGGAAAAAIAFGTAEVFVSRGKAGSFNGMVNCNSSLPDRGGQRCADLYDDGQRARTLALVGFGVGAALAATSLVLFLTTPDPLDRRALACAPHAGADVGLSCALVF